MARKPSHPLTRRDVMHLALGASIASAAAAANSATAAPRRAAVVHLEDLQISFITQGWGSPHKNESVGGHPLRVAGVTYRRGIGTHAASYLQIKLFGGARRFSSLCGINEASQTGAVRFSVYVDGKKVAESPVMKGNTAAHKLTADLRGAKNMTLVVEPAGPTINYDHADWIEPVIYMEPNAKKLPVASDDLIDRSIPDIASGNPDYPEFHGPRVVGCSPGKDFLFAVPHTGVEPVQIKAVGLPDGLSLDDRGFISGQVKQAGEYRVKLTAVNSHGSAKRTLKIIAGKHMLARTPAMGWNSWNAYGMDNSEKLTMAAADAMVSSGLAAKGFMYVNMDDGWQNGRRADGTIRTTSKFPSMSKLADHIHSRGLRFGVYSSPGPTTCGGHTGSFGHVQQDADTYAKWGVDYLKYDWCSYGAKVPPHPDLEQYIKPYREMGRALRSSDRDIFFSLCQYGMGHVWTWGGLYPVYGNSYRISGDINDSWEAVMNNGFLADGPLFPFSAPGRWNDPDMLVVGVGSFEDGPPHPTHLTPNEQVTHITHWCMLAAPLLLGCDLTILDKFTTDLMTNTEVLAVNQDELGKQAQRVYRKGSMEVWARPLFDGTVAVSIYNLGLMNQEIKIPSWSMVQPVVMPGVKPPMGRVTVRDLWRRKDLGRHAQFSASLKPHSALMLKVGEPHPDID